LFPLSPTSCRRISGYGSARFWQKFFGSDLAALQTPASAQLNRGRVSGILDSILDLAGGDIDDQLAELDRVAGAFEALGSHALNMARWPVSANPASNRDADCYIQTDPLPSG
jgi:hypothetical protein